MPASNTRSESAQPERVGLGAVFRLFFMAGALSFGGGVVAYLREYIVAGAHWLDDEEFLGALEISETLPGLISVNLAVVIGDNMRGIPGAAAAVLGMMLPGTVMVMTLGILWQEHRHNEKLIRFLIGVAAAAVGMLLTVALRLGHKQLTHLPDLLIVLATFLAMSIFHFSLLTVLVVLGPLAVWLYRPKRGQVHPPHLLEHLPFHRVPHTERLRH